MNVSSHGQQQFEIKGLVKYKVKSNKKKTPNARKSMLSFIAVEDFSYASRKTD